MASINLERRIVITGIGTICANGTTLPTFWDTVVRGEARAAEVTRFDVSGMPCRLAAEIPNFKATDYIDEKRAKRFDRSILFGIAAAKEAIADAGLNITKMDPDRIGIVEGTSVSGIENTLRAHSTFVERGFKSIQPTTLVNAFCGGASSEIAIELGLLCQATTICTACSAGNDAIGYAMRAIRDDLGDIMIAGATEAPIVDGYYTIFSSLGVMSRFRGQPASGAMRPFDRDRDGFVLGEGAAFLILEELNHALARGARIYAEVAGHGQSSDAYHSVALHPEGRGAIRAIQRALFYANMAPDEIDYVNAHGSATGTNDIVETLALKRVCGDHARKLQISATKPVTGHMTGGVAAVEAAICALSIYHGIIPPTANLSNPAEGCDLDYVPRTARHYRVRSALNLNAGFGGKTSALLLKAFPSA